MNPPGNANLGKSVRLERERNLLAAEVADLKQQLAHHLDELQKAHAKYIALQDAVMNHIRVSYVVDVVRIATQQRELAEMFRESPST